MTIYLSYDEAGNINGFGDSSEGFLRYLEAPEDFNFDEISDWRVVDGQLTPKRPIPPRILTHYGFRSLLTLSEQIILDNFDVPEFAAAHPVLSQFGPIEKATLRTAMKAYETASEINLDDPGTQMFVGALGQMGLLEGDAETRAATILAGYAPGQMPDQ
jgi:hypothetical protein